MKLILSILISISSFAATTRTFSCNGGYETESGQQISTIHDEVIYNESDENTNITLSGSDSLVLLTGKLTIQSGQEYMNVEVTLSDSGISMFNNNSQLGQDGTGDFNFVGLGLKNIGKILYEGQSNTVKSASFQCQSYQN